MRPDVQAHVEPDRVGQLDRSHRHAEIDGGRIDRCQRHAFLGNEHRFVDIGHQHAIDHESRRAAARQRQLVDLAGERDPGLEDLRARQAGLDDLDQRHLGDRIEEVQPHQPARVGQPLAQHLEHDAGRIGGEYRSGLETRLEACVQLALGIGVFVRSPR